MSRDLARERLKSIRTLQGWREAYKAAGLKDEGSDATKRRRLSRLINTRTSGAKKLDSKQRRKINRTYRRREKKGTFAQARAERAAKSIDRQKADERRQIRKLLREGKLTQAQADRRLRKAEKLNEEDLTALEEAFERAEMDGGAGIRREYAKHLSKIDREMMKVDMTIQNRRRDKALRAAYRDWRKETGNESMDFTTWKGKATADEQDRNDIKRWLDQGV
jgi:multidrug efflux pump subunit AcrA (membrane-fusion protein)